MKEYVTDRDEFYNLVSGRIHWVIERESVYYTGTNGIGKFQTGEYRLILQLTGLSSESYIITMKVDFGVHFPKADSYKEAIKSIKEFASKHFPEATEGRFDNV